MFQDYPHDTGANAVLRSVARDRHIPIVRHRDVFEAMLASGVPLSELFIPDMHCNDRGYRVMAENIARVFREMNLFPNPAGEAGSDRSARAMTRGKE